MGNGRTCYFWVTEGHVTFGLRKDMLHLGNGKTGYIWVTEGHVTFRLQKDMTFMTVTIRSCLQGLEILVVNNIGFSSCCTIVAGFNNGWSRDQALSFQTMSMIFLKLTLTCE